MSEQNESQEIEVIEPLVTVITEPVIVHEGRYRLYRKPDGTMRVQYRRNDKEIDDFFEIPGAMVALAQAASEGTISPMILIKRTMEIMERMGR
jgi:hypothetical protein